MTDNRYIPFKGVIIFPAFWAFGDKRRNNSSDQVTLIVTAVGLNNRAQTFSNVYCEVLVACKDSFSKFKRTVLKSGEANP